MYTIRQVHVAALTLGLLFPVIALTGTADAHEASGLDAAIVGSTEVVCDFGPPICRAEGRVRIFNNRRRGSGPIVICVGIKMHTADHRNLSLEPPTASGQAIATVRPGESKLTTYKTVFSMASGTPHHVHVKHTHKHISLGGQMC